MAARVLAELAVGVHLSFDGWARRRRGTVRTMAVERSGSLPAWNDRFFGAIPVPPIGVAVGLALTFLGLFLATVQVTGDLAVFARSEARWWQNRDVRLAVLLALLAAYLPAARRIENVGARRAFEELGRSLRWRPGQLEAARRSVEETGAPGRRLAGGLALLTIPFTALLVDRDPRLYLQPYYWDASHFWTYGLAVIATWNGGVLVHTIARHARCFADLARDAPEVDLLDPGGFEPFVRQSLRSAVPGVVLISFLALNLGDGGFLWAIGVLAPLALVQTSLPLVPVLRGIHQRISEARRRELARVDAAIRGGVRGLTGSPIELRAGEAGLADLLAWRSFVESRSAWPFGGSMRLRVLLFVAIPLGSWLGGALVERLLDRILG